MAGSEIRPKMEQGQSKVENRGIIASNLVLSRLGSLVKHVNNPSQADDYSYTEIAIGLDAYNVRYYYISFCQMFVLKLTCLRF